jgi:flagellar protein FlgJ
MKPVSLSTAPEPPKELTRIAREFEAIFLRKMLSAMERAGRADPEKGGAGNGVYASMIVGSLADSVSAAGGIGLAKTLVESLAAKVPAKEAVQGLNSEEP